MKDTTISVRMSKGSASEFIRKARDIELVNRKRLTPSKVIRALIWMYINGQIKGSDVVRANYQLEQEAK